SLIPEAERPAWHARVGRLLLSSTPEAKLAEHVLDIVSQLNAGCSMLDSDERARLAELNLLAGRKAKAAAAYDAATSYLATGVSLLRSDESSGPRAELAFELRLEHALCQILAGELDVARELLGALGTCARTKRQFTDVACAEIVIEVILGNDAGGAEIGLECLERFGIHWSAEPTWAEVLAEQSELDRKMAGREIDSLVDLPIMTAPEACAIMDLLTALKPAVVAGNRNLFCLVACRMVQTSIEFGNTANSGFGYLALAMAFTDYLARWEDGYRFAKVGREVAERLASPADRGKVYLDFSLICAWRRPFRESQPDFEQALEVTRQWGDIPHASYTYSNLAILLLLAGAPLPEIRRVIEDGLHYTRKTKYRFFEYVLQGLERFLANVEGRTMALGVLDSHGFEEGSYETELRTRGTSIALATGWFCTWMLVVRYLAGRYDEALLAAVEAKKLLRSSLILLPTAIYHVFHALTRAALADRAATPKDRTDHIDALREERETLRVLAERCSENFERHYMLIAAEMARVEGDHLEAQRLYERSIAIAREQSLLGAGALALELAAQYYLDRGFVRFGEVYLADARDSYERWGAAGKVTQLEQRYPSIARAGSCPRVPTVVASPEELDLLSVTKASQSIAEETKIEDVVCTLMRVALEQSVAQRGYLVLSDGTPRIRAAARCSEEGCTAEILTTPIAGSVLVPEPLVNYVLRSGQQIIVADASDPNRRQRLVPDDYVTRHTPRSILGHPIVRRGAIVGALYLENNLVTDGFTPQRVAALEVIAAQAAISLEIAHVLEEERRARLALARSESRFRRLYESNMIGIAFSDLSAHISDANDYVLDLLGYTRRDLAEGIRWDAGTLPEGAALDAKAVADLRASGTTQPFEKEYIRKDGSRVSVLIGPALLDSTSENVVTFVLDVTERRRLLLQEQQARADAERALRVRDDFIAVAAHELRTPLTPLKLQLQLLQKQLSEPEHSGTRGTSGPPHRELVKLFASADRQVDRLTRLVGDLLDFSRLGAGRLSLECEAVDLAELAREVVERHRTDWIRDNSPVVLDAPLPVRGSWDRQRIEQIVVNLLTNAMKYGAGKPIELTVCQKGDLAKLIVRDRGIGIRDEDQSRIFERFERAVSFKHFSGFGLGLYISMEIARAHGGTIHVASRLGVGSTFTLELPR
ncbi:MAG: hypothetical protein K0S65_3332, partial [Labilithrix sp.]|nr:hypothetical protein [Labilithrix sp.]